MSVRLADADAASRTIATLSLSRMTDLPRLVRFDFNEKAFIDRAKDKILSSRTN
jgi:hypothetical protein